MTSHKCGGESVVKKCIKPLSVSHGIIDPVLENIVEDINCDCGTSFTVSNPFIWCIDRTE